jgi:threonine/homoserine/homoserine lactone efflux protein
MTIPPQTFAWFALAVLALLVTPGPNMMFVLTSGAAHGWRGGFAAALGIGVVDLVFTLACATGLAGLLVAYPAAFDAIRWVGAAYLLWLAYGCMRTALRAENGIAASGRREQGSVFLRGLGSNIVNPKAILFFLVFIPQFIDAGRGAVFLQFVLLGASLAAIGVLFHGALGAMSAAAARLLSGDPRLRRRLYWVQAAVFALVALRLAV